MLRTYEGIIDHPVSIHEKKISWLTKTTLTSIQDQLKQLAAYGIIQFLPQKDTPQIHFLLNRASAPFLQINQDNYHFRKTQFSNRVKKMISYVTNQSSCRSKFIGTYFGDDANKACGICDHCLAKKRKVVTEAEFILIEENILKKMYSPYSVNQLLSDHPLMSKEKIWDVINFLLAEEVIQINEQGFILKK